MEHEAVAVLALQRVDDLLVALGAQGGHHQRLRLTAREQRRAVRARQHRRADLDRAHRAGVATVDTRLAVQNLAAHDLRFELEQDVVDFHAVGFHAGFGQLGRDRCVDFLQLLAAGRLLAQLVSGLQIGQAQLGHLGDQGFVLRRRLPVPLRLAAVAHQVVDRIDGDLHLLMAVHHGAQHHLFRQLVGFGFDHQHGTLGAGNHQVQVRMRQLRAVRVQQVLAVLVTHAGGAHRAVERQARHGQRGRSGHQRRDVGRHFRVDRQHVDDDLDFVVEAFREQRTQRTVDQARGQRLVFRRTAFTLEEATRDLAGGVGLLDVVDGQREEILARLGVLGAHHGGQHHGVVHVEQHGAAGLAGDLARLHAHLVVAPLEFLDDLVEHVFSCSVCAARIVACAATNTLRKTVRLQRCVYAIPARC